MLVHYIALVANGHIASHDSEPDTIEGYASDVDEMIKQMRLDGDEGALMLGIEHLLGHPEIDTEPFAGSHYPFDDADVRAILRYIHRRTWPGRPIPSTPPDVRLVDQPLMAWWARTD